jgi:hypothetical protein
MIQHQHHTHGELRDEVIDELDSAGGAIEGLCVDDAPARSNVGVTLLSGSDLGRHVGYELPVEIGVFLGF